MTKCGICNKEFENGRQLGGHKVNSHSKLECEICHKKVSARGYKKHISFHNREKNDITLNVCKKCGKRFYNKPFHTKGFCSLVCSNSRAMSEETRRKIYSTWSLKNKEKKLKELTCKFCHLKFEGDREVLYCSIECRKSGKSLNLSRVLKGKTGGVREGGGRGRHGKYKGYYYQSSWELAYIMYNIDNSIKFERNTKEKFPYKYGDKMYNYYPDFKLDENTFVEIKGYYTSRVREKLKSLPKNKRLIIIDRTSISKYINYATEMYGKDFADVSEMVKELVFQTSK